MEINKIFQGDNLSVLKTFADNSIDLVITSPPYFNLRSYLNKDHPDKSKEIGNEQTPEAYISKLLVIFNEAKRVLKPTGSCWINIADCYSTVSGSMGTKWNKQPKLSEEASKSMDFKQPKLNIPDKCLVGIPMMLEDGLRKQGWRIRNRIIWFKENAMPNCLDLKTKVFIKDNNKIEQITLGKLSTLNWENYYILSPNGWNKILNLWITKKYPIEFKTGCVDKIICSHNHKFGITTDTHNDRNLCINYKEIENIKRRHKLLYKNISPYFKGRKERIDITNINFVKWVSDFRYLTRKKFNKLIGLTPLELSQKMNDSTLKKYKGKNHKWSYSSKSIKEHITKIVDCSKLKLLKIKFNKVRAYWSPKIENRFFPLDYNLGWLIGIYIAEGGFNNPKSYQGKITLNVKEIKIAKKFIQLLKQKFNIDSRINKINNYIDIVFSSATFYALAKYIVKGKCNNKELNINFLINTSPKFRKGLFDGYIIGDGYSTQKRIIVVSASKKLIGGMQLIATTLGKVFSIGKRKIYDKRTNKKYIGYSLWSNSYHNFNKNNYSYIRIRNIKKLNKKRKLIDITTNNDNLFIIGNGLISHNSVEDRFSNSYEFLYFLVKSRKYYFDLDIIRKNPKNVSISRYGRQSNPDNHKEPYQKNSPISHLCKEYKEKIYGEDKGNRARVLASLHISHLKQDNVPSRNANTYKGFNERYNSKYQDTNYGGDGSSFRGHSGYFDDEGNYIGNIEGCNPRDVWTLPTYPEGDIEHYAQFPSTLLIQPILAGSKENDIVLDPFMGSGTTGLVAKVLNRNYIGIELNEEFIKMAETKINDPDKQKIVVEQMRQKFPEIYEKIYRENITIAKNFEQILADKNQNLLW